MKKTAILLLFLAGILLASGLSFAENTDEMMERTMKIQLPTFSQLNETDAFKKMNRTLYEESFTLLNSFSVDVETDFSNWDVVDYYSQATKTFDNNHIISFKMDQYLYPYRSAHGSHLFLGFVFDLETGKELKLNEVFEVNDVFIQKVNDMMMQTIKKEEIPIFDFTDFKGLEDDPEFYFHGDFLVLVYQEYAYTPYSYGPLTFQIPLDELQTWLSNNYF